MARLFSSVTFCGALLLAGTAQQAKAGFVGYYALSNFTLANLPSAVFANGFVTSTDPSTIVLTGPNTGIGFPGTTELTIAADVTGLFQFSYVYSSLDTPGYDDAGYILGSTFYEFADTNGESGSVVVPVSAGEIIGFEVASVDNLGEPGVLTVTDFSVGAPVTVPEPGSSRLLLFGAAAIIMVRNRRRIRLLRVMPRIVAVAVAAICFTSPMLAQSQIYYTPSNVTGQLSLLNVVNASQLALQSAGADEPLQSALAAGNLLRAPRPRLHPPTASMRLHPEMATAELPAALGATLVAPSLSVAPLSGTSGFNALSHLDQKDAYGGNQFSVEPPSPSIAVGNGYVLEGVNDAIQIYNTAGTPALPIVLASNQLFGLAPAINYTTGVNGVYLTDMRVYFDQNIDRWFVLERSQDNDIYGNELTSSHLYLAVSQTADPTGNYNIYVMTTTNASHNGCPCLPDYPQIGADQYGFHIAWNEYSTFTYEFLDASILTLSKASLASGAAAPTAVQVLVPFSTGFEFAIQPATTPPGAVSFLAAGGLEYFASTSSTAVSGSQIALWAMYNTSSLATSSPNLTLTQTTIPTLSYAAPFVANQQAGLIPLGTSVGDPLEFLDGGDCRVQSLTYSTGRLFLTFPTGVRDQNSALVVGGAYIVLSPTYRSGVLTAQVLNQGYLFVNSNHLLRPAIAMNSQPVPTGAIAVTLVGPNWYPSAALIPFQTFSTPSTIEVAATGALPEDGFSGYAYYGGDGVARWGDYNTAVAASDGSIWMAVEYIGNFPRTQFANWNTYVIWNQP
ncbi:MAG: PEP-CTERM sorting domain-containing protein [Bryobacteraceae bacterium]